MMIAGSLRRVFPLILFLGCVSHVCAGLEQAALSFSPRSPQAYGTTNTLRITGGSGTGAVSYAALSGPGEIVETNRLKMLAGTGTVWVVATKAADDMYNSAFATGQVTAVKAAQAIDFPVISNQWITNTVRLAATASSGLGVSFAVASGPATISGVTNVSLLGEGDVSIVASQSGDTNWNAAPGVTNTFRCFSVAVTDIRASQMDDGSGRVQIDYVLWRYPASSPAAVSLAFSTNDGLLWVDMNAGALAGDYGAAVTAGLRRAVWSSTQELPTNTFNHNVRVRVTAVAAGQTVTNLSDGYLIDLKGLQGGLRVSGRICSKAGLPLSTADISLAGTTNSLALAGGWFTLTNVAIIKGNILTVSNFGYTAHSEQISVPAGAKEAITGPIYLPPVSTGQPVITALKPKLEGIWIHGLQMSNEYTASVNWNGFVPDRVKFFANNVCVMDIPSPTGSQFTCAVNMGSDFRPILGSWSNHMDVSVYAHDEVTSEPSSSTQGVPVAVIPLPSWLGGLAFPALGFLNGQYSFELTFPPDGWSLIKDTPYPIGNFGSVVAIYIAVNYSVPDGGTWHILGSGKRSDIRLLQQGGQYERICDDDGSNIRPKNTGLYMGNKTVDVIVGLQLSGVLNLERGLALDTVSVHAELNQKWQWGWYGILDVVPGASSVVSVIPGGNNVVKQLSFGIYALINAAADVSLAFTNPTSLKEVSISPKLGLEALYEPKIWGIQAHVCVGGDVHGMLGITNWPPTAAKWSIGARAYLELSATWGFFKPSGNWVFLNWDTGSTSELGEPQFVWLPGAHNGELHTLSRDYLQHGGERFVAGDPRNAVKLGTEATPLDAFRAIGQAPVQGSVQAGLSGESVPLAKPQASLLIITNTFPDSAPALAGISSNLMLLYVADNENTNDLQYTDIRWTRWDGSNWSTPTAIVTDTRGEFGPQVKFDGDGDAIAVWERVTDPDFTNDDIAAMAALTEVVWSRWKQDTGSWTEPKALTTNTCLDHLPLLAGPLTNGDLLVTWVENPANFLMGMGPAGSTQNDTVVWSRWRAGGDAWDPPQVLVSNLFGRDSQSLSASSNLAVYSWSADGDWDWEDGTDQEVYAKVWSNDVWSESLRCTSNSVADRNVRVAVSPAGTVHMVWLEESNLVSALNFSAATTLVRPESGSAGFSDFAMTYGPNGNVALLWQEMTTNGSDAHYSVYDPVSDTWSKDATLFQDSTLERSFAPVWDHVGNLTVAYNAVDIVKTNVEVELEGGGSVTVSNVPQSGAVSLAVVKRALITDVAILPGDFVVEGDNHLPGDALTLSAVIRNVGDIAVTNAVVAFYERDPSAGGTLITNVAWDGWLEGAATDAVLSAVWVVPDPATNLTLYAVANPGRAFVEFTENNNTQSVSVGGTDLSVELISTAVETNGELLVIAHVENNGAPGATNTTLAIRREGEVGLPLATSAVPYLEPGKSAHVAFDLPAGTQPEGNAHYTLNVDESDAVLDVETNNDTITFAVYLWLDTDKDGMPNGWEDDNGLNRDDPSDAGGDEDEDGMTNYEEWRAGTDPNDDSSYLSVVDLVAPTNGLAMGAFVLTWGSESNRLYTVGRSAVLQNGIGFVPIAQHIQATPPENTYLDSDVGTNDWVFFYRIDVE